MSKLRVGVCGLGAMGGSMAKHLLREQFQVTGYDVYMPLVEGLEKIGAQSAATPKQCAKDVDVLLLMVTSHAQITSVLFSSSDGAIYGLKQNAVIMISSTVPPDYCEKVRFRLDEEFKREDVYLIDCPVTGGTYRAADGTLSIFSAGPDAGLAVAEPVLTALSSHLYKVPGGIGFGSRAKMCHQVLPEVGIALAAEVFALAARAGLNTQAVFDTVQQSPGASWIIGNRVPHALQNDTSIYSAIPNSFKDSSIIVQGAEAVSFPVFLVSMAQQVYQAGIYAGWGKDDDSTLHRLYMQGYPDDIIYCQTRVAGKGVNSDITVSDIVDIFAGGYLAATAEAFGFIKAIGLDADLMYNVVKEGAASCVQFVECFPKMTDSKSPLTDIATAKDIGLKLGNALHKANGIGASLPVASAALQLFHLQLGNLQS